MKYFESENELLSNPLTEKLKEAVKNQLVDGKGTFQDKLRLLAIYYLSNESITSDQVIELSDLMFGPKEEKKNEKDEKSETKPLTKDELQVRALIETIKNYKYISSVAENKSSSTSDRKTSSTSTSTTHGRSINFTSLVSKLGETVYAQSVDVLASLKKVFTPHKSLPVTKLVHHLLDNVEMDERIENFAYFDPKLTKSKGPIIKGRITTPFKEGFVFILGGACYLEYQNLQDYITRHNKKNPTSLKYVGYGGTELLSPEEFLSQLIETGDTSKKNTSNYNDIALD